MILHLDALKERAEGHDVDLPQAPFGYIVLQYRREMHMSLTDVRAMRPEDLLRDLEMLSLEAEYGPNNAKPPTLNG